MKPDYAVRHYRQTRTILPSQHMTERWQRRESMKREPLTSIETAVVGAVCIVGAIAVGSFFVALWRWL